MRDLSLRIEIRQQRLPLVVSKLPARHQRIQRLVARLDSLSIAALSPRMRSTVQAGHEDGRILDEKG
jgi:hypothetical protein